jgi:hypothetical protein
LKERRRLAVELLEADVPERTVIDQTGTSRTTVWRLRQQLADKPNRARDAASQSGGSVSNRPTLTRRSRTPILHLEATSGNGDFAAVARLLGGAR